MGLSGSPVVHELLMKLGSGGVRLFHGDRTAKIDFYPADDLCNLILSSVAYVNQCQHSEIDKDKNLLKHGLMFCHASSACSHPLLVGDMFRGLLGYFWRRPPPKYLIKSPVLWNDDALEGNFWFHSRRWFRYSCPLSCLSTFWNCSKQCERSNREAQEYLREVDDMNKRWSYWLSHQWSFDVRNTRYIMSALPDVDKIVFPSLDDEAHDWGKFMDPMAQSAIQYAIDATANDASRTVDVLARAPPPQRTVEAAEEETADADAEADADPDMDPVEGEATRELNAALQSQLSLLQTPPSSRSHQPQPRPPALALEMAPLARKLRDVR